MKKLWRFEYFDQQAKSQTYQGTWQHLDMKNGSMEKNKWHHLGLTCGVELALMWQLCGIMLADQWKAPMWPNQSMPHGPIH